MQRCSHSAQVHEHGNGNVTAHGLLWHPKDDIAFNVETQNEDYAPPYAASSRLVWPRREDVPGERSVRDYFNLCFPETQLGVILTQTNRNLQHLRQSPLSEQEFWEYVGVRLYSTFYAGFTVCVEAFFGLIFNAHLSCMAAVCLPRSSNSSGHPRNLTTCLPCNCTSGVASRLVASST